MVRRAIGIFALLVLVASAAGATGGVATDGYWWDALPNDAKANVMTGAGAAYAAGWREGRLSSAQAGLTAIAHSALTPDQKSAMQKELRSIAISALLAGAPSFEGRPIAAYVDGMNAFYVKHPDLNDMDFAAVFACLQSKPSRTCDAVAADYAKVKAARSR
jgi:hypothetical protein